MTVPVSDLVVEAARRGGEAIMAIKNRPREVISKGFRDEVTDADYAAQAAIVATIQAQYPDQLIASEENDVAPEEGTFTPPAGYWWLIDPLDGTTNFSRGIPHFCVSVAVLHGTTLIGGAIYDPNREHMFAAARGEGATLNGSPLQASQRTDPTQAVLEAGLARGRDARKKSLSIFNMLATNCRTVRSCGAAALALAYVAAGWLEGYVHLTLKPWDSAAGGLMIQEAGGRLALPGGGEWRARHPSVLATGAPLHDAIAGYVQDALTGA
jgi:myo-inositol-1(or 4)-monophosphatase